MQSSRLPRSLCALLAVFLSLSCTSTKKPPVPTDELAAGFVNPPQSARPHTWWHWVSGNVSREGITADLEAMKRIGLGGAQMFSVDQVPNPKYRGHVLYMSAEWRDLTRHAIAEATRLGLDLSIVGCEGWSESGGPWITPELSMQKIVWTEHHIAGPTTFDDKLDQPETVRGFYRDIVLYAFPSLPGERIKLADLKPKLTVSASTTQPATEPTDLARLTDGDAKTTIKLMPADDKSAYLTMEFEQPLRAGSFSIAPLPAEVKGELQVSDDGKAFRRVADLTGSRRERSGKTVVFDDVSAKWFRIFIPKTQRPISVGEISFASARVPDFKAKTGMEQTIMPDHPATADVPDDAVIHADRVIDLTRNMDADGHLKWDAPTGDWTIIRIGHTSTGKETHPAMKETAGLECDKMSRQAVRAMFDGMLAKVVADSKENIGKGLKLVLLDSWEAGCQNWTPKFREEFQQRRGYDPLPWMIAMSGRYVQSPQKTERFLWDYRRTIADLIAENHYGLLQQLCNENGLLLTAEAPGIGMPTIADALQCKGRTDVPMGEFWVNRHDDNGDTREAASGAHIYGKKVAAAESFTATPDNAKWTNDPYSLKAQGDEQYCAGINRFVFHRYAHQPDERKPGMTMGPWGINFERTNTWWEPGRAWITYLSRCQYMLQRGLFVADLLYYYGEGAPRNEQPSQFKPAPPAGYDYDACNREALLTRISVRDGKLVLPDGMSYRVLVLADTDVMSPQVLAKVKQLVSDGATVIGPKPKQSPSLNNYPKCDEEVARIADEVWGDCDGKSVTEHAYGKGRVYWGKPITDVLAASRIAPDFTSKHENADAGIRFIHRRDGDADIYFLANPNENFAAVECTFRVSGKQPELWHPDTGEIETVVAYSPGDGTTTVPIRFDPFGSHIVIFRKPASDTRERIVSVKQGETNVLAQAVVVTPQQHAKVEITKAIYGVPDGKPEQQIDVTSQLANLVKNGSLTVQAGNALAGKDPLYGTVKTLNVEYTLDGKPMTKSVPENSVLRIPDEVLLDGHPAAELRGDASLEVWERGDYTITTANGKQMTIRVPVVTQPIEITSPWDVRFPPKLGAPDSITLEHLMPLNKHADPGVKYFSGTATYTTMVNISADVLGQGKKLYLELGAVKNLAQVSVNGKDLGILWKPPFRVDVTHAVHAGPNEIGVRVTNLWPNRLIGDAGLPVEQRATWTAFDAYKKDSPLLPSGLIGPVRLVPTVLAPLRK